MSGSIYRDYVKRIFDIVSVLILMLLFSPLVVIAAIMIKLESSGPVMADVPERVGQHGGLFKMHKFRSMVENAHHMLKHDEKFKLLYEQYKQGSYKLKEDPRITKAGKFIRRHSIDEIPQLLNVLSGEMSLVGPRAYYPDELEEQQKKYPHTAPLVKKVLTARPGITGLWQVSGRSNVNFDKRIAIDAKYVDNMSLMQDIIIALKTPWAMISGRGAI